MRVAFSIVPVLLVAAGCAGDGAGSTQGLAVAQAQDLAGQSILERTTHRCDGTLRVLMSEGTTALIKTGQSAAFATGRPDVPWSCSGSGQADVACPQSTSHVRVTRAGTGDEVIFDCLGIR